MKKRLRLIYYIGLIIISISCSVGTLKLVDQGKSPYKIVIPEGANEMEKKAASELQYSLARVSGVTLPIVSDSVRYKPEEIIIGRSSHLNNLATRPDFPQLKEDGFRVYTEDKTLVLAGGSHKGTLYAVYYFLEEYLGCRMFAPDAVEIPHKRKVRIPQIDETQQPTFNYREVSSLYPRTSQEYADWHKLDNASASENEWGIWGFSFNRLVPVQQYFINHPEYFAEIDGKRVSGGQLCLSNPDLISVVTKSLQTEIGKNPSAKYWSVSPNDNNTFCTCSRCRALDQKYGGHAGTLIHFVNQIASKFPDKIISTLATQYTRQAPRNIKPASNVLVVMSTSGLNRSKPIAEDPESATFRRDLENWRSLTQNIMIWDIPIQVRSLIGPFPNFYNLKPNLQYFARNHCKMVLEEGSGNSVSEFHELRSYLTAKLLWNSNADFNSILDDFLNGYYGPAGTYLRQYIDVMYYALEESEKKLDTYGYPFDSSNSFLTPDMINKYTELFDKAEMSVFDDPVLLQRVKRARLPLEYAILEISLRDVYPGLSFLKNQNVHPEENTEMLLRLSRFVRECEEQGIEKLDVNGYTPKDFRANVKHYISNANVENLAHNKRVRMFTRWNNKFPVGGAHALVDGRFGVLDSHYNWLGFENQDMEATIDLGASQPVKTIYTNFLQQPDEWIFLPGKVMFYLSNDGLRYIKIASLQSHYPPSQGRILIQTYKRSFRKMKARYIKVVAKSLKTCPSWHAGAGKPAWMLIDEVVVQ
ncbi:MAG: DUF4838 domain-containing protein [Bacteroidota bacterium]|nr:DUF4838 domain-containing protein [Bacteroidota bacterium]